MDKDEILERVHDRLLSISFIVKESDHLAINLAYDKAIFEVKNFCNIARIPKELTNAVIELTLGYFLKGLCTSEYLQGESTTGDIKSISEGDISITYDTDDTDETFNSYVDDLINTAKNSLISFRRLKW